MSCQVHVHQTVCLTLSICTLLSSWLFFLIAFCNPRFIADAVKKCLFSGDDDRGWG